MSGEPERIKSGFSIWNRRIAPVFDVATHLLLVEVDGEQLVSESHVQLVEEAPLPRSFQLAELGLTTLVCGAISRPMLTSISAYGIQVLPFVSGAVSEVLDAWLSGNLESEAFAMPGACFGRGRRRQGVGRLGREEWTMGRGKASGAGIWGAPGTGRGGRRDRVDAAGRRGGPVSAGPGGRCVCPDCGHTEAHERGLPCMQRSCPKCGSLMMRQHD